jgi:putative DNA primase/helicase
MTLLDDVLAGRYHDQPANIQEDLRTLANNRLMSEDERDGLVARVLAGEPLVDLLRERHRRMATVEPPVELGGGIFVEKGRLLVATLYEAVITTTPLAVHPSGDIWLWRDGRFIGDRLAVDRLVTTLLGDDFRAEHLKTFKTYAAATLDGDGRHLGAGRTHLINVANGVLDPFTGALDAAEPGHLFTWQLPVPWEPGAACPKFDDWFAAVLPNRALRDALLEDVALVLDQRPRQKKAVFLVGMTRTGKSTLARIVTAIAGTDNCSAEELYDLSTNRFRAAELYGKLLNVASDIKTAHLADVSVFKKATGADDISAEHKFGHPFKFRYHGLFLWTMNLVPTVEENASPAYLARIRPYRFSRSFLGKEDPSIEEHIVAHELPGVLVRLVAALQRFEKRRGYVTNDDTRREMSWFRRETDRLAMFLDEATRPGAWTPRVPLHRAYERWCQENRRGHAMNRRTFYRELDERGYARARHGGTDGFNGLVLIDDWDPDDSDDQAVDDGDEPPLARAHELSQPSPSSPQRRPLDRSRGKRGRLNKPIRARDEPSPACSHSLASRQPDGSVRCSYCGALVEK